MHISLYQHVGMDFNRIIKAFIVYRDEPGGPAAYFSNNLSSFENVFGSATYILQTLLGDAFVVSCVVCSILGMHHVYCLAASMCDRVGPQLLDNSHPTSLLGW